MNLSEIQAQYQEFKEQALKLDMSRGKPSPEQLGLSSELLQTLVNHMATDVDTRNYGGLGGLLEARVLFGDLLVCLHHKSS